MKKITMLKIEGCPYCEQAYKAIEKIKASNKEFAAVEVEIIDENLQPELASKYGKDYYYDECFANVQKVFQAAI